MEELNSNEEPHVLPPKRKQTTQDEDPTKKLRSDDAAVEDKVTHDNGGKDEIKDEIRDEIEDEEEEEEEDYEGEDEIDDDDDDDDDDDNDDDDNDERFNGGGEVDRKGKGVMKDDKGKGKMIEESEEEDDDDDSDEDGGGSESDGDDDLSDDPLTEVDLDNILPSRTRRRTAPAGVRISGDEIGKGGGDA